MVQVGAAQAFVEGEFGGPVNVGLAELQSSPTSQRFLLNDPERLSVTFVNLGIYTVYLMFDAEVSATRGIAINASGGFVNMDVRTDQMLPTREWWVISPTGYSDMIAIYTKRYSYTFQPL
jgi:hypothetical protein